MIEQTLNHQQIFVFGELLQIPMVQKVAVSSKKHYDTLTLFAYETWGTYKKSPGNYIKLTDKMEKKLRILTLVHMAGKSN